MGFFSKKEWRVVKVAVVMDAHDMDLWAFKTACELVDDGAASKLYYARYADPNTRQTWVEFKLYPLVEDEAITDSLQTRNGPEILKVAIEPFEGSDDHAKAFELARILRGKGDPHVADVVHWLMNMTGFGYTQETRFFASMAYNTANQLVVMEQQGNLNKA